MDAGLNIRQQATMVHCVFCPINCSMDGQTNLACRRFVSQKLTAERSNEHRQQVWAKPGTDTMLRCSSSPISYSNLMAVWTTAKAPGPSMSAAHVPFDCLRAVLGSAGPPVQGLASVLRTRVLVVPVAAQTLARPPAAPAQPCSAGVAARLASTLPPIAGHDAQMAGWLGTSAV